MSFVCFAAIFFSPARRLRCSSSPPFRRLCFVFILASRRRRTATGFFLLPIYLTQYFAGFRIHFETSFDRNVHCRWFSVCDERAPRGKHAPNFDSTERERQQRPEEREMKHGGEISFVEDLRIIRRRAHSGRTGPLHVLVMRQWRTFSVSWWEQKTVIKPINITIISFFSFPFSLALCWRASLRLRQQRSMAPTGPPPEAYVVWQTLLDGGKAFAASRHLALHCSADRPRLLRVRRRFYYYCCTHRTDI